VPAGTTTVGFSFLPPHESLAGGAVIIALVVLLGSLISGRVRRRRTADRGS